MNVFRRSRAANSALRGQIRPKFELAWNFMRVLLTCKNEDDPIKNEGAGVLTRFPHYNHMGVICCHEKISDPIWPKTSCSFSPTAMIKFVCDRPASFGDIHV